jgi:hypothetical protein
LRVKHFLPVHLAIALLLVGTARAYQAAEPVAVPNLIGLTVPQAARQLSEIKLLIGTETAQEWTATEVNPATNASFQANQITGQTPAAGQTLAPGASVQVTVLRAYNAVLTYNADGLTLHNTIIVPLNLTGVIFKTGEGKELREFKASEWGKPVDIKGCYYIGAARLEDNPRDCETLARQIVATQAAKQFWTTGTFTVEQNGITIATCTASPCNLTVPQGDNPDQAAYLSFQYRTNYLTVRNPSDRWMTLTGVTINGRNGRKFALGTAQDKAPGDVPWAGSRLAPEQCIVYSELDIGSLPPYDCAVVAYVKLPAGAAFWQKGFSITTSVTRRTSNCGAPLPGLLSICRVPR